MVALDKTRFRRAVSALCRADPALAGVARAYGEPEFWHRPPGFATLVLFILEQQVSLASARMAFERLAAAAGEMTPAGVLALDDAALRTAGCSRQKARYVRALAGAVLTGSLDVAGLGRLDDDEARSRLMRVVGIGEWTAAVYLLSCLRRPDVWPVGDRALQVGTAEVLALPHVPGPGELAEIGERWRPHRSSAARIVWHGYLAVRGRVSGGPA